MLAGEDVDQLEVAWTFRTGELGQGVKDWSRSAFEATPILHDGTLYLTTSSTDVVAVNAVMLKRLRLISPADAHIDSADQTNPVSGLVKGAIL